MGKKRQKDLFPRIKKLVEDGKLHQPFRAIEIPFLKKVGVF
jgi:hypothetical protein